ncbi:hypothetical protein L6452_01057 [Arctium lappa]|uniref:Uncharacterized protein n=1 Tax=Arctium lappa TaxID=4217 RepID=A0ACB9FFU9_ARCLA|nr:hypothetical protein L6452_01057 [Arctium lappa]
MPLTPPIQGSFNQASLGLAKTITTRHCNHVAYFFMGCHLLILPSCGKMIYDHRFVGCWRSMATDVAELVLILVSS